MPIYPSTSIAVSTDDKSAAIPINVTLTTANVSQVLFTVPVGRKLRSFSLVNQGPGKAHVSMVAGAAATTSATGMEKDVDAWSEDLLDLPDGTYSFINGGASNKPRLVGVAWTSAV